MSVLSAESYVISGLSVAAAIVAFVSLAIASLILLRSRASSPSRFYGALVAALSAWLGSFALVYASADAGTALFWSRAAYLAAAFVAPAALQFAVSEAGMRRQYRLTARITWIVFAAVGAIAAFTPLVVNSVHWYAWGFYPAASGGSVFFALLCAGPVVAAAGLLMLAYRRTDGTARERAGGLVLACVLGSLSFFDVLPTFGFDIYPVGYTSMLAFVVISAASLWRYRLVDLTPQYAASQILETMKSAVLLIDMEGRLRVVNRTALQLLGYTADELIGQHLRKILPHDEGISTKRLLNSTGVLEQSMKWVDAGGTPIDVLASSSFIRDGEGVPIGVVYVATDHTERRRVEQAVRESEHRYRTLFDANPLPMWVYDYDTLQFSAVNDAAIREYGFSREEFHSMRITDIRPAEELPAVLELLPKLEQRRGPNPFRHRKKDGTVIDVEVSSFEFESGGRKSRLVISRDVTERRRSEDRLRASEARYRALFQRNLAGVYRTTTTGAVLDCNDAFARIFGYESRAEMLESTATALYFNVEDRARLITRLREQKALTNIEARMRRSDGTPVWVLENMTLLNDEGTDVIEGTIIDITDRKIAQEQIEYQAYHDSLTGLPNRLLFTDRIGVALAHARRTARVVAVMFLDLDVFKRINDTLGHPVGDRLLQSIAMRVVDAVRAEDTVARMGGDEFTVLLSDVADSNGAAIVARKILEAIAQPVIVDGHEINVTTSIGIALYPGDGFEPEALLKSADRAMYRAKQLGRNNYQFATPPPADDRGALERRLRQAYERKELVLHYQPIIEIETGKIRTVEALLRWNDPARGLIFPEAFMAVAEESSLMIDIGDWVLHSVCEQVCSWRESAYPDLRGAVNLSVRQFSQRDLPAVIGKVLDETGLPAHALELEITESTAMYNAEQSLTTMRKLKDMGVRISIDDFGTGFSSLSYLKRFPIDTVKIDQEFIRDLTTDTNDRGIISAVISMARALKLRVVGEGVETEEQLEFLRREGCTDMQGYLHSKPVPPAELDKVMSAMISRG